MNLLIFKASQYVKDTSNIEITGRQHIHLSQTLKKVVGDTVKIGELNGNIGTGTLILSTQDKTILSVVLDQNALAPLPLDIILALPRPQMIKRILQTSACMGVANIHLIQTQKVEKNYWQSPAVTDESIEEHLLLGLEQAGSTFKPKVYKHKNINLFFKQDLPTITKQCDTALIAHLCETRRCPSFVDNPNTKVVLAIGPEGGFTQEEVDTFTNAQFDTIQLGRRVLRVETAVTALISKLFY